MKHTLFVLSALLMIWGCSQSSSTSKGGSSSGTTSGNPITGCSQADYNTVGSPCYCQIYPTSTNCVGSTTSGSTTGSTTGGSSYGTIPSDNSWTALYGGKQDNGTPKPTVPAVSCGAPTGTGFGTRKGTITMAFQKDTTAPADDYSPATPGISNYTNNISSFLTNVNEAKMFVETDALLKARFMPRPQPKPSAGNVYCFGRKTGFGSGTQYGYTKLSFSVSVRAVNADGSLGPHQGTQYLTTNINSCSPGLDFSGFAQSAPNGLVLVVHDVFSDQSCDYYPCNGWSQTTTTCWQMDVEVAVDGTKSF